MSLSSRLIIFLILVWGVTIVIGATPDSSSDAVMREARAFVENFSSGNCDALHPKLDSAMNSLMTPGKCHELWDNLVSKVGPFSKIAGVRSEASSIYTIALVTCAFQKDDVDIKLVYNRAGKIAGMFFVQTKPEAFYTTPDYAVADSFREVLVTIGDPPWILHGTLTLPRHGQHLPAVVLVHGSGPNDRDETVGPNKPFKDLAYGLATRGIAVLRYEKRTREHSSKMFAIKDALTVKEETIDDALAAATMLRGRDEIDGQRIFVLGHSLGGMLIPRIAARDTALAGFIVMAGLARPLEDAIFDQMQYIMGRDTLKSDSVRTLLQRIRTQVAQVKSPTLVASTPSSFLPLGLPAAYWLDLRGYDPPALAARSMKPMLVMQGARDYQVTMNDYERWHNALSKRSTVQFKLYSDLNHLFVSGKQKSAPAEYEEPGNVSRKVVDDIATWVLRQ